jgi:hypothetical protein
VGVAGVVALGTGVTETGLCFSMPVGLLGSKSG